MDNGKDDRRKANQTNCYGFFSHFHFPQFEHGKAEIRIHNIDVVTNEDFRFTMDEEKIRDYHGSPLPEHFNLRQSDTISHPYIYHLSAGWDEY